MQSLKNKISYITDSCKAINRYLVVFEKCLLCFCLFFMLFLSLWQIILRNFFSGGFFWIDQILRLCVLWIAFTGASLAFQYKRHIKIDVLTAIVRPGRIKNTVSLIACLSSLVICLILFAASIEYIQMAATNRHATIIPAVPDWYFRLIIPYCFFVMTIRTLLNTDSLFNPESTDPED